MENQSQMLKKYVNTIHVAGTITEQPTYVFTCHDEKFYTSTITSDRLSGQQDHIPLLVSEKLVPYFIKYKQSNSKVLLTGEVRTHNTKDHHLIMTTFVKSIEILPENIDETTNNVVLEGFICKQVNFRTTPFGREIADIIIAVNRFNKKTDYIPCIVWGRNAQFSRNLQIGDKISLTGRFQSRNYEKKTEDSVEIKTAYEISVNQINRIQDEDIDQLTEEI